MRTPNLERVVAAVVFAAVVFAAAGYVMWRWAGFPITVIVLLSLVLAELVVDDG